jgi:hypothetical protein
MYAAQIHLSSFAEVPNGYIGLHLELHGILTLVMLEKGPLLGAVLRFGFPLAPDSAFNYPDRLHPSGSRVRGFGPHDASEAGHASDGLVGVRCH